MGLSLHLDSASRLRSVLWPAEKNFIKEVVLVFAAAFLLALSSQVSIPWTPVPLTFQSATVLAIGMVCGARLGTYSVLTYLCAGAVGLPVFADLSGGLPYFFGPTGGYLLGFVPGAFVAGYFAQNGLGKNIFSSFLASFLGALPIFVFGSVVLSFFVGAKLSFLLGVKPFLLTELIKLFIVSLFVPKFWSRKC